MSQEEEGAEEPEALDPHQLVVASGEETELEYNYGILAPPTTESSCAVVVVSEVDDKLLVAIPEGAWHKTRKKRKVDPDLLQRPIAVLVPLCALSDRSVPDSTPTTKVWLGLLGAQFQDMIFSDVGQADFVFPLDDVGMMKLPYAPALLAVAKDHFTFLSAESAAPQPGLSQSPQVVYEARMSALEDGLQEIKQLLVAQQPAAPRPPALRNAKPKVKFSPSALPEGVDPAVAQQALQAGVSPAALQDIAASMGLPIQSKMTAQAAAVAVSSDEEEEDFNLGGGRGAAIGSGDPMETAVLQLTKLVTALQRSKTTKKDKELEAILDRAESGSARDAVGGSSRSKAAALLSLQKLLRTSPQLIYVAVEKRLQEDWEQAALQPGVQHNVISARGWIEHRSRIQGFPSTARAAWCLGGIWDCLRTGRYDEARARAALGVCVLDQQACDSGSFLLATELSLEDPPPMTSFQQHQAPAPWELPHSKLVGPRWMDLVVAKVKDLADFHEKRAKLSSQIRPRAPAEDQAPAPKPKAKAKQKGTGKGKQVNAEENKDSKEAAA